MEAAVSAAHCRKPWVIEEALSADETTLVVFNW